MGIRIHNLTMSEAVETIVDWGRDTDQRQVAFLNADCANIAWRDPQYAAILNDADLTLGDGIGIKVAAKALGLQLKQNVNGTDLFPRLCDAFQGQPGGLFLLGARPGIAEAVAGWVTERYPGAKIAGFHDGYFSPSEEPRVVDEIRKSGATVLLVALGAPNQDRWISRNLASTGVKVAMGVGGLFDFYSGRIPRAPQWLREMGLEWVYRLCQEPGRMWRRYLLGNLAFLYHVAIQRRRDYAEDRNTNKGIQK
jgi:N-acetylglucosaminyldiphosphoundecaprenol N-acetyl-beta-D-mannosaminyltransferase